MWIPTKGRLETALSDFVARLEIVQHHLSLVLKDSRLFDRLLGPSEETEELNDRGERLLVSILAIRQSLQIGEVTFQEVNTRLSAMHKMVRAHETMFSVFENARKAGDRAADTYFRSKNA